MKRLFLLAAILAAVLPTRPAQAQLAERAPVYDEMIVLTLAVNAYEEPRSSSRLVATYAYNERVHVLGQLGPYYKVAPLDGGEAGYAPITHFIPANPNVVVDLAPEQAEPKKKAEEAGPVAVAAPAVMSPVVPAEDVGEVGEARADRPTLPSPVARRSTPRLTFDLGGEVAQPTSRLFRQAYGMGTGGSLRASLQVRGAWRATGRAAYSQFGFDAEELAGSGTFHVLSGAAGVEWMAHRRGRLSLAYLAEAGLYRMAFLGLGDNPDVLKIGNRTEMGLSLSARFRLELTSFAGLFVEPAYEVVRVEGADYLHYAPTRIGLTLNR